MRGLLTVIRKILLIFGIVLCTMLMNGCYISLPVAMESKIIQDSRFSDLRELELKRPLTIYSGFYSGEHVGEEALGGLPLIKFIDLEGNTSLLTDFPVVKKGYYILEPGTKIRVKYIRRDIDSIFLIPIKYSVEVTFTVPDDPVLKDRSYIYIWGGFCTLKRAPWEGEEAPESRFFNPFIE